MPPTVEVSPFEEIEGSPRIRSSSLIRAMVIAIDGPAGAGKSTVARAVAERLDFTYLDTGAMYRCVALAVTERGGEPAEVAEAVEIELGDRVLLDGRDVTDAIRTPAVAEAASQVSADIGVRMALVRKQQEILGEGDWVAEGRDVGTVVCPQAQVKVFLTASPEARARRRAEELGADYETVLAEQLQRDDRDERRRHSPLLAANDAVPVDTTELDLEEVLDQILTLVVEAREIEA
jgi:cytidylate kinase